MITWGSGRNKKMGVNERTYKINGAVFEVNRILGSGFLEKVYENALLVELRKRGLRAENQVQSGFNTKVNLSVIISLILLWKTK